MATQASRSIPAHAGEPPSPGPDLGRGQVDPRSRGGASAVTSFPATAIGRSPLTRGSPIRYPDAVPYGRSIPAHAGEPRSLGSRSRGFPVDPRSRGGAGGVDPAKSAYQGRSPLTRGSHMALARYMPIVGSIPAHAGEPGGTGCPAPDSEVDPRSRGGARLAFQFLQQPDGRSPLTRGSPC